MGQVIDIADRKVGSGQPCFIIAEAGVNHNGSCDLARQLVEVAKAAGADAVKFQTFRAERLVTQEAPKAAYQMQANSWSETQFAMLKKLELCPDLHYELQAYCRELGLIFLSTPFDEESADFLEALGVPAFKISSGDITNLPFLKHIAHKGRPIILSTGMSYLSEVDEAVQVIRQAGNEQLVLLHCISNYPADPADVNLRAMETMRLAFQVPVGYSDHTLGIEVALAAVALGACVIEKHFTLDKNLPGPDHQASLEPRELRQLVKGIRSIEQALGSWAKRPVEAEHNTRGIARRSLVAACEIQAGSIISKEMIAMKRPGTGIEPKWIDFIIGRRAKKPLRKDEALTWEAIL